MTENQIKAASLKEEIRHNQAQEALSAMQNEATKSHYERQDQYTGEHYQRSDTAGLISANAGAINAQASLSQADTAKKRYAMDYDIEYGWTGDKGYPQGMPLSAQKKSAELEYFTLDEDSKMPAVQLERERRSSENAKSKAEALNKVTTAYTSILNSVFGKGGVVSTVEKNLE